MELKRVLIVDESAALCESLDLVLSSYGQTVMTCRDVREASKLEHFDAYVIEAKDGVDAFAQARRDAGSVVLLMGRDVSRDEAQQRVAAAGAHGWAQKPFEALGLLKTLRAIRADR